MVDALLRGVPHFGYKPPIRLLRGRIGKHNLFVDPSEFSYAPPSERAGRCHRPGSAIFYGSNNLDTVLSELAPEPGEFVHVGVAKLKQGDEPTIAAVGELDHVRRYDRPLLGNEDTTQLAQAFMQTPDAIRALVVDAFFADAFRAPARHARDYKVTAAISELLLDGKNGLDGFAYPSVAHRGGLNVVVRPD